jgi:hypothetical protein
VVIDFLENVTPYRKILFSKIMQKYFLKSGVLHPKKPSTYDTNHGSADSVEKFNRLIFSTTLVLKNSTK